MSTIEPLPNFRNTLQCFGEKMSLLGYGPLFPNFKGKQNNCTFVYVKSCNNFYP